MLDREPILPGEAECAAALRLLGRIRRLYGPRFFDGVTGDAGYAQGPFWRALDKLGWLWMIVLKREEMDVFQEALVLSQGQKPCQQFRDDRRGRQVQLGEVLSLAEVDQGFGRQSAQPAADFFEGRPPEIPV